MPAPSGPSPLSTVRRSGGRSAQNHGGSPRRGGRGGGRRSSSGWYEAVGPTRRFLIAAFRLQRQQQRDRFAGNIGGKARDNPTKSGAHDGTTECGIDPTKSGALEDGWRTGRLGTDDSAHRI